MIEKKFEILDTTSNLYETFDWIKKISIKFPKLESRSSTTIIIY